MGQVINGYIYHTKYDTIDVIPRESLQNTGDNVLSLVRGLSNATELYNTEVSNTYKLSLFILYHINLFIYRLIKLDMLSISISWDFISSTILRQLESH